MYVLDNSGWQAMTRECDKDLASRLSPQNVMWHTPAGDGAEQQTEVILTSKLLCWGNVVAQTNQHLKQEDKTDTWCCTSSQPQRAKQEHGRGHVKTDVWRADLSPPYTPASSTQEVKLHRHTSSWREKSKDTKSQADSIQSLYYTTSSARDMYLQQACQHLRGETAGCHLTAINSRLRLSLRASSAPSHWEDKVAVMYKQAPERWKGMDTLRNLIYWRPRPPLTTMGSRLQTIIQKHSFNCTFPFYAVKNV